jgi:hypothetical protein
VMPGVIDTPMTTDANLEAAELGSVPDFFKMPVRWVTWAVLAAAAFGLAEVDVPPGAGVGEKIASLFPGMTDAFLSVGAKMFKAANRFVSNGPKAATEAIRSELKKEREELHKKAEEGQRKHHDQKSA